MAKFNWLYNNPIVKNLTEFFEFITYRSEHAKNQKTIAYLERDIAILATPQERMAKAQENITAYRKEKNKKKKAYLDNMVEDAINYKEMAYFGLPYLSIMVNFCEAELQKAKSLEEKIDLANALQTVGFNQESAAASFYTNPIKVANIITEQAATETQPEVAEILYKNLASDLKKMTPEMKHVDWSHSVDNVISTLALSNLKATDSRIDLLTFFSENTTFVSHDLCDRSIEKLNVFQNSGLSNQSALETSLQRIIEKSFENNG